MMPAVYYFWSQGRIFSVRYIHSIYYVYTFFRRKVAEYMGAKKMACLPKVTIVMAIYQPNKKWLAQQLESLNQQDYEGELELLAWNDSPACTEHQEILQLLQQYITSFPYRLLYDGRNHGATRAFEKLTEAADGKYIAYCDQDDVWLPGKVRQAVRVMEDDKNILICHIGISLIDEQGSIFSHLAYPAEISVVNDSAYQQQRFLLKNFAFGCAMLVRTAFAKSVLPFPGNGVYHDQWLACCAAYSGRVSFIEEKLLLHRLHRDNNSSLLHGISSRKEYCSRKLARDTALAGSLLAWYKLKEHGSSASPAALEILLPIVRWTEARNMYNQMPGFTTLFNLLHNVRIRPDITLFEILLPLLPEAIFKKCLALIQFRVAGILRS